MSAHILPSPSLTIVELPPGLERGLPPSEVPRPESFLSQYERRVLFYDVFWHADGKRVLMVGPPPVDLASQYEAMTCVAQPSGTAVPIRAHRSERTELREVTPPAGSTHLTLTIGGQSQTVPIGPSHADFFAGSRMLFTLSQNNRLDWIADWARFHVVHQNTDGVVVFDNGSTAYMIADLEAALAGVEGLKRAAVVSMPRSYGRKDEAAPNGPYWAQFLKAASMLITFRRFGQKAYGLLNCDVDELAVNLGKRNIYDVAARSRSGTTYYPGSWIAPVPEAGSAAPYRHRDFRRVEADRSKGMGSTHKWVLAPQRRWLERLNIHPYPHVLENRVFATRHKPKDAFIAHFRAVSTSWKYDRPVEQGNPEALPVEPHLAAALDRAFGPRTGSP
jgi:hypothetical protein